MITITTYSHEVNDADRERAALAAEAVLTHAGVSPAEAYADFLARGGEDDDEDRMTGLARAWVLARRAADAVITEGWSDVASDVFCELSI